MRETIRVCPECDYPRVRRRVPDAPQSWGPDTQWRCLTCGAGFDDPVEREPMPQGNGRPGLAGRLAAADAEEVAGDE